MKNTLNLDCLNNDKQCGGFSLSHAALSLASALSLSRPPRFYNNVRNVITRKARSKTTMCTLLMRWSTTI
jgi:hypothetical protein